MSVFYRLMMGDWHYNKEYHIYQRITKLIPKVGWWATHCIGLPCIFLPILFQRCILSIAEVTCILFQDPVQLLIYCYGYLGMTVNVEALDGVVPTTPSFLVCSFVDFVVIVLRQQDARNEGPDVDLNLIWLSVWRQV